MKLTPLSLLALACAAAPAASWAGVEFGINIGVPEVVIQSQPPPERGEVIPPQPGPGYVYIRGHWAWRHERWEWIRGRWEYPQQPGAVWVPGAWVARGGGWVWVEGHYQVPPPPPPVVVQAAPPPVVVQAGPPPPPVAETFQVEVEPPAPVVEAVPVAPGPDFFWIGGRWSWQGRWVWVRGHFERHPHWHPGGYWEAGHWDREHGHFVWHEGRWH